MPINLGEAIGLGSKQRIRSGELTQAANRFIQLDQQKRARQAAKEAEDQKYADEIYKSLTLKVGKLNQPRTEEAMRVVSEFAVNTRNKEGKIDRLKAQSEFEKATAQLQGLNKEQETDDNNAKVYQTNRNAFGGMNVLQYGEVIKNDPYLATRIYQDSGFNVPILRNVQYVDPTEFEDKVVNTLKKQIKPTSTGTVIGGDIITERKLTKEQAKDLAAANIGDGSTNYAISLYNTQKPEIFRRAEENMQKDPNLSGDLAITSAMIDLSTERMLGQGAWFDKSRPRSSGGGGGKTPEEQGWNIDVQASNLAYEENPEPTTPYDKLFAPRKSQSKGDIVGFSQQSKRSEKDYLPFVNSIPKVVPPAADESTKKTVLTYKGGNVTNTDILYFVQDPITHKWFAKVSDETSSKLFGEKMLASAGLVPINERDYATIASSYKKSKNFIVNLFNKASAQYLPKTGGTTEKKATTGSKQSTKKEASLSTIRSLVGKKGYEGYTEKELVDYYKSQGYTIK